MSFIREEMKILPALVSFSLFMLFIAPVSVNIINIGNITGAAITGTATFIFIFYRHFKRFIGSLWESTGGKICVSAVILLIIACFCTAAVISFFMVREIHDYPPDTQTTAVVLGCKVKDGRPSLMLKKRLDAAYRYLSENPDVKVVVSGGKGDDEVISEAQCMKEYLTGKGISPERIYMEDKSTDTAENLLFSKELILSEGLYTDITIVTDGFHQLRADMIAENLDMKAYNVSAKTSPWLLPTYWIREWYGVLYCKMF